MKYKSLITPVINFVCVCVCGVAAEQQRSGGGESSRPLHPGADTISPPWSSPTRLSLHA